MAALNTLLRVTKVTENIIRNAPLTGIGGNPLEPALSIGDWVRQFCLQPPFAWRWNRAVVSFPTLNDGTQDYPQNLPNFGWLESSTVNNGTTIYTAETVLSLGEDSSGSRPRFVSARLDDDAGNITFRVHPSPDAVYTIISTYQKACPTFSSLSDTWAPLPDYMYNIYAQGFLAKAYEYIDDTRAIPAYQLFLRSLLSVSEGLSESQKRAFASDFLNSTRQEQSVSLSGQLGKQARSGL
jgi:hypothetical protein